MKFKLAELKKLNQEELRRQWFLIDLDEHNIEIDGDSFSTSISDFTYVYNSLDYIPPHVSHMTFKGKFEYVRSTYTSDNSATILSETVIYESLGGYLAYLVSKVPPTITSLKFSLFLSLKSGESYDHIESKVSRDMSKVLAYLPKTVTHLDLSELCYEEEPGDNWREMVLMYQAIPKTVKVLKMHDSNWWACPTSALNLIFQHIQSFVEDLSWEGFYLSEVNLSDIQRFFTGRIQKLSLKDHSYRDTLTRNFDRRPSSKQFSEFLSRIPQNITELNISDNKFDTLDLAQLKGVFESFPAHLQSLDVGDNGLLYLSREEFYDLFTKLSPHVKQLRLIDRILHFHDFASILDYYAHLPAHIQILSFSDSKHLKLSVRFYIHVLKVLPANIHTLDFSNSSLPDYDLTQIEHIFKEIPRTISKIIFKRNNLINQNLTSIARIFSKFPSTIHEIDIGENGLDKLKYSSLSRFMHALPDRVYALGQDKITRTHDGRFLPYYPRTDTIYYKPINKFRVQAGISICFLVIHQLMQQKNLNPSIFLRVCSFLYDLHDARERASFEKNITKASLFLPSKRNQPKQDILKTVLKRIKFTKGHSLDLSSCQLNLLTQANDFIDIFKSIPKFVQTLNLRKNNLNQPKAIDAFKASFAYLPQNIQYLDISANGFNPGDMNVLGQFSLLHKTLKFISFGLERPVSLDEHIKRTIIPNYLPRLMTQATSAKEKVKILLNDYTQGNSWFWRFIYGFWNRQHIPEVSKLIYLLSLEYYEFIEDIMHKIDLIEMSNEAGALSKSRLLLDREVPTWRDFRP